MFSIGQCSVCGAGPLGLRRCGVCRRVVVLCDECDAAWLGGKESGKPTFTNEQEMPCPGCRSDLWQGGSWWASREEIERASWWDTTRFELSEGDSLEPGR